MSADAVTALATLGSGFGGAATAFVGYLLWAKRHSGKVGTTDADALWKEAGSLRREMREENEVLRKLIVELRRERGALFERITALEADKERLHEQLNILRADKERQQREIDALQAALDLKEQRIAELEERLRAANEALTPAEAEA